MNLRTVCIVAFWGAVAGQNVAPRPAQSALPMDSLSNLPVQKIGVEAYSH